MHSKKTKYIVLLVLLISMGFGYLARGFLDESATHQPLENMISTQINAKASENAHNRITQENSVKKSAQDQYRAYLANKPLYLQNTEIPAKFTLDEQGNLVINSDIRDIFDYFLLMKGDLSDNQIELIIAGYIETELQEPARSQATILLSHYRDYLQRYAQWRKESGAEFGTQADSITLRETLQQLHSLRIEVLGESVESSFFGEEEQTNNAYLDAKIAMNQTNGDEQARKQVIENLRSALPDEVRQAQDAAMMQVTLSEKVNAMKAAGASADQIEKERTALVGVEASQRLAALDDERKIWDQKRAAYKEFRKQHPEIDDMTQESMVAVPALSNLSLSPQDLMRMKALDRIDASGHPVQPD